jgi:hypothetical protein
MPGKKSTFALRTPKSRVLAVAVVWAAATAALVMGRPQPDATTSDVKIQNAAMVQPTPQKAAASRVQARRTTAKATSGADVSPVASVSKASAEDSAAAASRTPVQDSPITVIGCLEQDDDTFRLKQTAGAEAPRSRSWKSGFLKKSAASIEVIDGANRLGLPTHVGQRISVTGMLVDGEMQVRSLRRVAATCEEKSEA